MQDIILSAGKSWRAGNGGEMRRRFQLGGVRKRGTRHSVWEGRYYEPVMVEGTLKKVRRAVILGSCAEMGKGQARRRLQEILRPLNEGLHSPTQAMKFGDFCTKWKKEIGENYRTSTRRFYASTLDRWIVPHFTDWPLESIKTADVQSFLNRFRNYSGSVLKHIRATLSRVFATAVDWEYIQRSPVSGLRLPRGKPVQRARVLSPVEIRLLINNLAEPYRTMAIILAGTIIRESELLALKWTDFDWLRQVIAVQRSLYRGQVDGTKSKKGTRDIPFGEIVASAVLVLRNSSYNRGEYLFLTERGKIYDPRVVERLGFDPLITRLQMRAFTWRSFRRSGATTLHTHNVPLKVQQDIMGHADPDLSLLYTEADLDQRRKAIELLEQTVFAMQNEKSDATWTQVADKMTPGRLN
jgi:integrase